MPASELRRIPLARVWLYDPGQGDPVVTDHGFVWYDVIQESGRYGTIVNLASGNPSAEVLEGVGLVCRPSLVVQDTRLTHYVKTGGSWDERRVGPERKFRLIQTDTTAGLAWEAKGAHELPDDPHCAFSLAMPESPPDWDVTADPQYVRLDLGGESGAYSWSIYLDREGAWLLRDVAGTWIPVLEIPGGVRAFDDVIEWYIYLRVLRGQILISTDFGRTYAIYSDPLGESLTIPGGSFRLSGNGGACVFGFHQLAYASATYTSPPRGTLTARLLPAVSLSGSGATPSGTNYVLTDQGDHANGLARWRAALSPATTPTTYFAFHRTPELYSVLYEIPKVASVPSLGFTEPWDGRIEAIDIDKPADLGEGTCTIVVRLNAATESFGGAYRRRKIRVFLGHELQTGAAEYLNVFTGYIRSLEASWTQYPTGRLTIVADNATVRLREPTWTEQEQKSLGGQTVNAALDALLSSEGLGPGYRTWHNQGALILLPAGSAEEPFEMIVPGESKWATAARLAAYAGLELLAADDGRFLTLPRDYAAQIVSHVIRAEPISTLSELLRQGSVALDYSEMATVVIVTARDAAGQDISAWVRDAAAEVLPFSDRFSPWRIVARSQASAGSTPGLLAVQALGMASELFALAVDANLATMVRLNQARRDRIAVEGLRGIGLPDGAELITLTLQHRYRADPSWQSCDTVATARRVL
jgi:hypothetical protein